MSNSQFLLTKNQNEFTDIDLLLTLLNDNENESPPEEIKVQMEFLLKSLLEIDQIYRFLLKANKKPSLLYYETNKDLNTFVQKSLELIQGIPIESEEFLINQFENIQTIKDKTRRVLLCDNRVKGFYDFIELTYWKLRIKKITNSIKTIFQLSPEEIQMEELENKKDQMQNCLEQLKEKELDSSLILELENLINSSKILISCLHFYRQDNINENLDEIQELLQKEKLTILFEKSPLIEVFMSKINKKPNETNENEIESNNFENNKENLIQNTQQNKDQINNFNFNLNKSTSSSKDNKEDLFLNKDDNNDDMSLNKKIKKPIGKQNKHHSPSESPFHDSPSLKQIYTELNGLEQSFHAFGTDIPNTIYEKFLQIFQNFNQIEKHANKEQKKKVKEKLFLFKVELMQAATHHKNSSLLRIPYKVLQKDLEIGYNLIEDFENAKNLAPSLDFIEKCLEEAEHIFEHVATQTQDPDKIEELFNNLPLLLRYFLDISEEILEYKAAFSYDSSAKINYKSNSMKIAEKLREKNGFAEVYNELTQRKRAQKREKHKIKKERHKYVTILIQILSRFKLNKEHCVYYAKKIDEIIYENYHAAISLDLYSEKHQKLSEILIFMASGLKTVAKEFKYREFDRESILKLCDIDDLNKISEVIVGKEVQPGKKRGRKPKNEKKSKEINEVSEKKEIVVKKKRGRKRKNEVKDEFLKIAKEIFVENNENKKIDFKEKKENSPLINEEEGNETNKEEERELKKIDRKEVKAKKTPIIKTNENKSQNVNEINKNKRNLREKNKVKTNDNLKALITRKNTYKRLRKNDDDDNKNKNKSNLNDEKLLENPPIKKRILSRSDSNKTKEQKLLTPQNPNKNISASKVPNNKLSVLFQSKLNKPQQIDPPHGLEQLFKKSNNISLERNNKPAEVKKTCKIIIEINSSEGETKKNNIKYKNIKTNKNPKKSSSNLNNNDSFSENHILYDPDNSMNDKSSYEEARTSEFHGKIPVHLQKKEENPEDDDMIIMKFLEKNPNKRVFCPNPIHQLFKGEFKFLSSSRKTVIELLTSENPYIFPMPAFQYKKPNKPKILTSGFINIENFTNFYFKNQNINNRELLVGWVRPCDAVSEANLKELAQDLHSKENITGFKFGKKNCASVHFVSIIDLNFNDYTKELKKRVKVFWKHDFDIDLAFLVTVNRDLLNFDEDMQEIISFDNLNHEWIEKENLNIQEDYEVELEKGFKNLREELNFQNEIEGILNKNDEKMDIEDEDLEENQAFLRNFKSESNILRRENKKNVNY